MKKLIKIFATIVIATMTVGLFAVWFLTTESGESLVRDYLESRLSSEIGLPVSIGRFETNFWSRVQVDTLRVAADTSDGGTPLLYIGNLRLDYSLPALLGETIALQALTVDSVAIGLEVDSLGRFGVPMIDAPSPEVAPIEEPATALVVDSIALSRIGLLYSDSQLPLTLDVSGTVISARGESDGSYSGRVMVSDIMATHDSLTLNIRDLDIAAALSNQTIHLEYMNAECEGLQLAAAGEIDLSGPREMGLDVTVDGSLERLSTVIASTYGTTVPESGWLSVESRVEGTADKPRVSLESRFLKVALPNMIVDSGRVRAQYADGGISIDDFKLSVFEGTISGTGMTAPNPPSSIALDLTLEGVAVSSIWRAVYGEASPYRGKLNGTVGVQGQGRDWSRWAVEAALAGESLMYENRQVPNLTCEARLDSGRTVLLVVHGADEIRADLQLSSDSLQGEFNVAIPDLTALARFLDQPDVVGSIWARGTVGGSYANPALRATVTGTQLNYRNFPVESLTAEISYGDSSLTLVDLACAGALDSIDSHHAPFDLDSLGGSLSYEGQLSGPISELQGSLLLSLKAPRYAQHKLDSLDAELVLNGAQIELTRLQAFHGDVGARLDAVFDTTSGAGSFNLLVKPLAVELNNGDEPVFESIPAREEFGSVSGQFTLSPNSHLGATVRGDRLWLGMISRFTGDTLQIDGEVDFELMVDGPYLRPNATLETRVRSLGVSGYLIDSVVTHFRLDSSAVWLDSLTSFALEHKLQASGRVDLSITENGALGVADNGLIEAELETRDFDLAVLSGLVLPEGELSGSLSSAVQVSGAVASPNFRGWLATTRGRVRLDETSSPMDNIKLAMTFADTLFTIDSASGDIAGTQLRARGSVLVSRFESALVDLDMQVGGLGRLEIDGSVSETDVNLEIFSDTLDLAVFQPFTPKLDSLRGRLGGRVKIEGQPAAPQISGSLRVRSLMLQSLRQNIRCDEGYADMRFDRSQVTLDSASATLNGGRLTISGSLTHDQGELIDLDLALQASNVLLEEPGTYAAAIDSGAIRYGRQNENYVLDGDVVLGETRFTAGLRATSVLPWVQSIETVDMELPELLARSRLNVRIRESDKLWVDNNLARIRLRAELGIIGTPLRPNFTGLVRIEEGYLLYLDRRFKVNEGSVYFNDPVRFNPDINLDASTQVTVYRRTAAEPYTIYIKAEGLLDQLQYGLYSEPPLERPDIVALLTLGATRTELTKSNGTNGQGGLTQVLRDRAAMLTSQRVSGYLSKKAGAVFGFDSFTIRGNLFQFDDKWGPQLIASKRLSRRIDLTYSTTVGQLNDQAVKLGYRLTPRWSLMGETDRAGRSGVDLKYGFTFK